MAYPTGLSLISQFGEMFPIFFSVSANRFDWSVNDASYGAGKYSIQANTQDAKGNLYQSVIYVDEVAQTMKHILCIVSAQPTVVVWSSPEEVIPWFTLFRDAQDLVHMDFSMVSNNPFQRGVQLTIRAAGIIYFTSVTFFPKEHQPDFSTFGGGLVGIGNGSRADFTNSLFTVQVNEDGVTPDNLLSLGGAECGETSNLVADVADIQTWQTGAQFILPFHDPSIETIPA